MTLDDFLGDNRLTNEWVDFRTKTGFLSVYVRRHIADPRVITIANVSTRGGFGSARTLYLTRMAHIPAIAENVINDALDMMLVKWGWTTAYRDDLGIPTRTNAMFDRLFGTEHRSPFTAVLHARKIKT